MSLFDTIKELFSGASDHAQNLTDTVQNIGDSEVAQQVKDGAADFGTQAQDVVTGVGEKAQDAATNIKGSLGK